MLYTYRSSFLTARLSLALCAAGAACFGQAQVIPQRPQAGVIEFYGVKKTPVDKLRKALGFAEGGYIPSSRGETELRLRTVPGVVNAQVQAICCDDGKAIVYVGIEERGAGRFDYRTEPEGDVNVPEAVENAYLAFIGTVNEAAREGVTAEDLTNGHSLMAYPPAREKQLQFVELAEAHDGQLRKVIHESGDPSQRAMAVYVLGYAKSKPRVVDELFYALKDVDDTVRSNAIRALGAISVKAKLDPEAEIKVPATWFIEMLNSIAWSDRTQAARFLVNLSESRDRRILDQMRDRAYDALVEMAKWKQAEHSLPAYILVGRIGGIPEEDLQQAWSTGDRDLMIQRATAPFQKKK